MKCLVLGSALNLWQDIDAALSVGEFDDVIAVKGAGEHWPGKLRAWVTLHPDRFDASYQKRAARGFPAPDICIAHETLRHPSWRHIDAYMTYRWPEQNTSGSSGLFAVKVALEFGYERIVLCGMPMDKSFGKIDVGPRWAGMDSFKRGFTQALPHIKDNVRSMSGWTRGLLGSPTEQWLDEV